jgi:(heptosyl)LPS beta-1,4-glucosyltransferase
MGTKISFITFTRNSERRLELLLENVKDVVDEIIVVDGFSNDDTVEIAMSYGAKVFGESLGAM